MVAPESLASINDSRRIVSQPEWWKSPDYSEGELYLPGQSRLDEAGRSLLEELSGSARRGEIEIPVIPRIAREVMTLLRSADPDVDQVVDCIQLDPALTVQVLRHANSALYGTRVPIDSVAHAVSYIGVRRLKVMILEITMKNAAAGLSSRIYSQLEWTFSLHCAAIAKSFADTLGLDAEQCYTAGLIHDIGRLPLLNELERRRALPPKPEAGSNAEIILECLHRGLGVEVAKQWEMPPAVLDAVGHHLNGRAHDEESTARFPATRVTEAAGDLCYALGLGRERVPFSVMEAPSFRDLGLDEEFLAEYFERTLPGILADVQSLI